MWITIIDRTKPQEPQKPPKPQQYQIKFEGLPTKIKATEIKGLPFKINITGYDNSAVATIDTTPQKPDPQMAVYFGLDLIPLLFANKIKIKIPNVIIGVILLVIILILITGAIIGYFIKGVI